MKLKCCKKCSAVKVLADFYEHAQMGDGHLSFCKECVKKRLRQARSKALEKHRAKDRAGYLRTDRFRHKLKCLVCKRIFTNQTRRQKFCSKSCANQGSNNPMWSGGRHRSADGYMYVWTPYHPNARRGYVAEHRLVMEKHLQRFLRRDEDVHHVNEIKDDNRLQNLRVLSRSEHIRAHRGGIKT